MGLSGIGMEYSGHLYKLIQDHFIPSRKANIEPCQIMYRFIQDGFDTSNQTLYKPHEELGTLSAFSYKLGYYTLLVQF
jgi:hypothetical protein